MKKTGVGSVTTAAPAGITTPGTFKILPLSELRESPLNNRKHYDEKKLAELTESIRTKGVLTPLLARYAGLSFEIAAGHRRYRAAKAAGVDRVPVLVREMSDVEFLEVLTIENLQREDVHPMDEAAGYKELVDKHGYTAEILAERVGKSKEYVYARMKLADLIPELQARFYKDEITAGHAILLARLPEASQIQATKEVFDTDHFTDPVTGKPRSEKVLISVRELQSLIRRDIQMDLSKALFNIEDASLVRQAGACIVCPKRTGAEPHLWPEIGKSDLCTDRVCFNKKFNAHIEEKVSSGEMVKLTGSDADRGKKGMIYDDYSLVKIKPGVKTCEDAIVGIMVDGYDRGTTKKICPNKSCKVHYRSNGSANRSGRTQKSPSEQLKDAQQSINQSMDAELRKKIYEVAAQKVDVLVSDFPKLANRKALTRILQLVYDRTDSSVRNKLTAEFGFKKGQYGSSAPSTAVAKHAEKFDSAQLMALTIKIVLRNLSLGFTTGWSSEQKSASKELIEIAESYGVKAGPIETDIEKQRKEKIAKAKARIEAAKKSKPKKKSKLHTSAKSKAEPDDEDPITDDDFDTEED